MIGDENFHGYPKSSADGSDRQGMIAVRGRYNAPRGLLACQAKQLVRCSANLECADFLEIVEFQEDVCATGLTQSARKFQRCFTDVSPDPLFCGD